ncbi:MAG: peptide chain release factor N(5)-glutamine methyltransferase [Candidatus Auribacter fodinae]|jgi:release factor glutamine methyltransferase|uniref:Release factor glutamine methyltransferase n=1 Tax=Candidatus Auribacter fodinae TaxID=2093366 RepID=A0A3A4QRQ3_9BACT|nr:MAG: peptide chain release factor N(5)-glutamine methyltransferase [Candidatus Auribacter fodinae]
MAEHARQIIQNKKVWQILDVINWGKDYLEQHSVELPRLVIETLLMSVLKCKRIDLYMQHDKPLTAEELGEVKKGVLECVEGKPLQYIVGEVEFYDTILTVTQDVLIPRPETEILVDAVIRDYSSSSHDGEVSVLDIGTGSGNIAIAIAKKIENCRIFAADISSKAIEVAKKNAIRNKVEKKITFFTADIMQNWKRSSSLQFEYIVSNPPYIPENEVLPLSVRDYEPHQALFAGCDGLLFYERIVTSCSGWLKKGGKLFFEIGIHQHSRVDRLMTDNGYCNVSFINDLQGIARVARGVYQGTKE